MNRDELNDFWADRPRMFDFGKPEPEPSKSETVCPQSLPFGMWCARLIDLVADDPDPERVAYAKYKLIDRYCRYYHRTDPDHRPENNLDRHPCFHKLLMEAWDALEDMDLRRGVPELGPPESGNFASSGSRPLKPAGGAEIRQATEEELAADFAPLDGDSFAVGQFTDMS